MKPFSLIGSSALLVAFVAMAGQANANQKKAIEGRSSIQPNIVVLLADDLGWGDVGFHGGSAETPNIDRLAAEGVTLNRFYAYPACSPARAAMLTGRFPHRYGISGPVRGRDEGLPTTERLLPKDFQQAGYQTSLIGKWHLGAASQAGTHPTQRGFDHFYGFTDAFIDYFQHTAGRGQVDWQRNGKTIHEPGYSTDLLSAEAVQQINARDKRKPFLMFVSFNAPHSPFQAPESLIAKYSNRLNEREATYAAMVDSMDQGIGRILSALDKQQLRDNTIVVFTSDNGAARSGTNAPFRGQKRQVLEGGIHVPFVIRAPGKLNAGAKSNQLAAIHDLLPTLAEAAGVRIVDQKPLDGISLWGNLKAETDQSRTLVIAEEDFAIIRDDWKLIQSASGETELYNLRSDATESNNQASQQPEIVAKLKSQLSQFQNQVARDLPANTGFVQTAAIANAQAIALTSTSAGDQQEGEALATATLRGDVTYGVLGDRRVESNGSGIRLLSAKDTDGNGQFAGEATLPQVVTNPEQRWYRYTITGMAQDNFQVDADELYLKVEFFQKSGTDSLDLIKTRIYPQVLRERTDLKDEATNRSLGNGTWRTYSMDFRTPFAQVDQLKLSVGFANGKGSGSRSEFWVRSMSIAPIPVPENYQPPASGSGFPQPNPKSLVSLGGRWYYNPQGGDRTPPKMFDHTNAEQLLYKSGRFEAPFAGNMSSWLRAGYLDLAGKPVEEDQERPQSLIVTFTDKHLVMRSRNLPNHPTATFPDRWRLLDGNPSYIQEQANTWYIPLEPRPATGAIAMDANNSNEALPMGAIGVATNGVIFFNPFDHINETDAVWRLDRCCGHPSPRNQYHYHKYPVCVKTPWSDEGEDHSSLIGFAFDGFPVYGPYEAKGLLAKDDTQNRLNDFNLHTDDQRGPHYHVTPGQFPHIIGGYWGEVEPLNGRRRSRP